MAEAEVKRLIGLTDAFLERRSNVFFAPISMQQMATSQDVPAKGKVWAARTTFSVADVEPIGTLVNDAIRSLGNEAAHRVPLKVSVEDVHVQWSGFRAAAEPKEEEPEIEEDEKYRRLMTETTSQVTMLHCHGGFY
jgi:hypothetical protein